MEARREGGREAQAKDADGATPGHWGAQEGHAEVVGTLLKAGADVNAKDAGGRAPLDVAYDNRPADKTEQTEWNDVIELLKQHGAQRSVAEDG